MSKELVREHGESPSYSSFSFVPEMSITVKQSSSQTWLLRDIKYDVGIEKGIEITLGHILGVSLRLSFSCIVFYFRRKRYPGTIAFFLLTGIILVLYYEELVYLTLFLLSPAKFSFTYIFPVAKSMAPLMPSTQSRHLASSAPTPNMTARNSSFGAWNRLLRFITRSLVILQIM